MKTKNFLTSACRYCRYYNPEGRRGGMCQQLGVPVQAKWNACVLAAPPFASTWDSLEQIAFLNKSLSLESSADFSSVKASESEDILEQKQPATV